MAGQLTSEEEKVDRRWTDARFGLMCCLMALMIMGLAFAIWRKQASSGFHLNACVPLAFLLVFEFGCFRIRGLVNRSVECGSMSPMVGEKIVDMVSTLMFCCAFAIIALAKLIL